MTTLVAYFKCTKDGPAYSGYVRFLGDWSKFNGCTMNWGAGVINEEVKAFDMICNMLLDDTKPDDRILRAEPNEKVITFISYEP